MESKAVCPHYVAAISAPGVHVILCCDFLRKVGQLVNGECTADIEGHVRRRCRNQSWVNCPYVNELAYVHEPLGVAVVSVLQACIQGQTPSDGGAGHD